MNFFDAPQQIGSAAVLQCSGGARGGGERKLFLNTFSLEKKYQPFTAPPVPLT